MNRKTEGDRVDIHTRITNRIVADLEKGVRPWMKPWDAANTQGRITRPLRHNGQPYSGMSVLLLWSEGMARGFASPMWMTFKQALELGAAVRKDETGSTVVFASRFTKSETDGNGNDIDRQIPFLKAYSVFNVDQIDGLPDHYYHRPEPALDPVERIENADRFFRNTGAVIRHGGSQTYYSPVTDHIQMPPFETFRDAASYVATLSHEATHYAVSRIMPHARFDCCSVWLFPVARAGIINPFVGWNRADNFRTAIFGHRKSKPLSRLIFRRILGGSNYCVDLRNDLR